MERNRIVMPVLLVCGLVFSPAVGRGTDAITLVRDGQPRAAIWLSTAANSIERAAAQDLQEYLSRMSGAKLSIRKGTPPAGQPAVLIGHGQRARQLVSDVLDEQHLGFDGFVIRTRADCLVLAGIDKNHKYREEHEGNGTRFAVFALLEKLGCRFYNPSPVGEHIPRLDTITVSDLNIVSKPDFARRRVDVSGHIRDHDSERTKQAWNRWYVQNRFGGVPITTSHNYDGICPPRLFAEHPEYFAFDRSKNRRVLTEDGQICLSNKQVVERAIRESRRFLNNRKDALGASLSPADADMDQWCQCDSCLAMDHADPGIGVATRVLAFNNRVAAEVQKSHPDRLLTYYADYFQVNMTGPPVLGNGTVVLKAHPQVVPVIVNRFCYLHAIDDPDCPLNTNYRWRLRAWSQVAKRLMSYEYYTHLFDLPRTPTPQTWLIGGRIRHYKAMNFISYKVGALNRWPDNELACYLAGRLAWDASQDDRALIEEFFRLYFQEAGNPMRAYYRRLNLVGRQTDSHGMFVAHADWTPQVLAELQAAIEVAQASAQQPLIKRRVRREADALRALTLVCRALAARRAWKEESTPQNRKLGIEAAEAAIAWVREIADQDLVASRRIESTFQQQIKQYLRR